LEVRRKMPKRRSSKKSFNNAYLLLLLVALVLILPYAQKVLKPANVLAISMITISGNPQVKNQVQTPTGQIVYFENTYYVLTLTANGWNKFTGYKLEFTNQTLNGIMIGGKQAYLKKNLELVITPLNTNLSTPLATLPQYQILPSLKGYYWDFVNNGLQKYSTKQLTVNAFKVPDLRSWSIEGGFVGYLYVNGQNQTFTSLNGKDIQLNVGGETVTIKSLGSLANDLTPPSFGSLTIFSLPKEYENSGVPSLNGSKYAFVADLPENIRDSYCKYWYGYSYQNLLSTWADETQAYILSGYYSKFDSRKDYYNYPGFIERQSWEAAGFGGTSNLKYYYHPRDPSDTSQISKGTVFPIGWPLVKAYNQDVPVGTSPGAIGYGQVYFARSGMNFWQYLTTQYNLQDPSSWTILKDSYGNVIHVKYAITNNKLTLVPESNAFFTDVITVLIPVELVDTFVYNPGLSSFKITNIVKDFTTLVGGGSGKISVTIKNTGTSVGSANLYVDFANSTVMVQPSKVTGIVLQPGEEKTFDFQVSAPNIDATTSITFILQDYMAKEWDRKSVDISIYARKGITAISQAYFEPGRVLPPAEVNLIVRLSSSAQQKVALVLSDYDKSIFSFDIETQTVNLPVTNDYSVKFHAKVKPFSTSSVSVKVTLYDDHNTKLGEYIATLYYDSNTPPPPPPIDWTLILMLAGVIIILLLIIVLLAGGKGWVANLPLFLVILVVIVVLALLVTGYSFSKITSNLPSFANFLPSSNFGQVPLYIVLGLPGVVLLLFAGNMKKNIRTTATMLGLLLTVGAVLSFMYASNILVPFEVAVVSVIFAFIIYLVGRRGKTGPKGERKSSGSSGTSTTVHFSWGGK
jgi:hypothetical protein